MSLCRRRRGSTFVALTDRYGCCFQELLEDDDGSGLDEEDDGVGCPLPSTPVEQSLLETEITEVLKAGVLSDEIDLGVLAHNAAETAEEFVRKVRPFSIANYFDTYQETDLICFAGLGSILESSQLQNITSVASGQ